MKPALHIVAVRLRGGVSPTALEYGEPLREVGYTPAEARGLFERYVEATATAPHSGEADLLASLRSFSLGP